VGEGVGSSPNQETSPLGYGYFLCFHSILFSFFSCCKLPWHNYEIVLRTISLGRGSGGANERLRRFSGSSRLKDAGVPNTSESDESIQKNAVDRIVTTKR
jgi:hypothetical protein